MQVIDTMKRSTSQIPGVVRRRARRVAAEVLFQDTFHREDAWDWRAHVALRMAGFPDALDFCQDLILGVRQRRHELDRLLQTVLVHWNLGRLARTDLTVLRIGVYELTQTQTSPKIVINEAIETARALGGKDSSAFVNGVLDRLFRHRADAPIQQSCSLEPPSE